MKISYAYGQKSMGWKSREISGNQKSSCHARAAFLLRIYSSVDCSKLQGRPCSGARIRGSLVPAGRPYPRETEKSLEIHRKLEISWKSVEITWKSGNLLKSRGNLEISWKSRSFRNLGRHNGPCRTPRPSANMHIGFFTCFHSISLERSRFRKIALLFFRLA